MNICQQTMWLADNPLREKYVSVNRNFVLMDDLYDDYLSVFVCSAARAKAAGYQIHKADKGKRYVELTEYFADDNFDATCEVLYVGRDRVYICHRSTQLECDLRSRELFFNSVTARFDKAQTVKDRWIPDFMTTETVRDMSQWMLRQNTVIRDICDFLGFELPHYSLTRLIIHVYNAEDCKVFMLKDLSSSSELCSYNKLFSYNKLSSYSKLSIYSEVFV